MILRNCFWNAAAVRFRICFLLGGLVVLAQGSVPVAIADDPAPVGLSDRARRALIWLPEDTESVVAGQSFTISTEMLGKPLLESEKPFAELVATRGLGVLMDLDAKYLEPVVGRKIALALRGNRNFDWVSASLPTHRSESCSIIVFEKELLDAEKQLIDLLRAGAEKVRKIAGRDVFVFPPSRQMRRDRAWDWRGNLGTFIVLLESDTLLCATSDSYLEDVLKRVGAQVERAAIPENLAVWKQIDARAPAWMVWSPWATVKKFGGEPLIDGITWTVTQVELRNVYLAGKEAEQLERLARRMWTNKDLEIPPKFERSKDGAIVVFAPTTDLGPIDTFWFVFCLYQLEAANVGSADK
jgi:hypothetical protein